MNHDTAIDAKVVTKVKMIRVKVECPQNFQAQGTSLNALKLASLKVAKLSGSAKPKWLTAVKITTSRRKTG